MRRICCFCEKWASGGIESFLNNILLHMDLTDMEVDIVAACVKDSVFTAGLKEKGVRFIELSGKLRSMENHTLFRKLLRERKYDVVHFNLFQGLSLSYVQAAKGEGVPVRIAHSHGSNLRKSRLKPLKLLLHSVGKTLWCGAATEYWACSQKAAEFLFSGEEHCFIPNGIDVAKFRFCDAVREKVREELGVSEKVILGTVGRLSPEKNHRFLLNVFQKFHLAHPHSVLLLVGEGAEKAALVEQAESLGISDCVVFYGTSQRVNELLCAMDVFILPSIFEGLPFAAVEAQASGLPVLCSEGVSPETYITGSVKALPLGTEMVWVEETVKMLALNCDRLKAAGVVERAGFDIRAVADKIHGRYMGQEG